MKRILSQKTLREFWEKHPASEQHLKTWYDTARKSDWRTPHDIKATYGNASIVGDNRVVFNIKGNDYRLIVKFNFERSWAFILFIGTHSEYDKSMRQKCKLFYDYDKYKADKV
jgi:mRNA interferase HigB